MNLKIGTPQPLPGRRVVALIDRPFRIDPMRRLTMATKDKNPGLVLEQIAGLLGVPPDATIGDVVNAIAALQEAAAAGDAPPAATAPADAALRERSGAKLTARERGFCLARGIAPEAFAAKKAEIRARGRLSEREERMLAEGDPKTLAARVAEYADAKASIELQKAGGR